LLFFCRLLSLLAGIAIMQVCLLNPWFIGGSFEKLVRRYPSTQRSRISIR